MAEWPSRHIGDWIKLLVGLIKALKTAPPWYSNSVMLNRLGWQRFRYNWMNLNRLEPLSGSAEYHDIITRIGEDGVVVIENFLPDDAFRRLRDEAESRFSTAPKKDIGGAIETVEVMDSPTFQGSLAADPRILSAARAVSHRPVVKLPTPYIWVLQGKENSDEAAGVTNESQLAHADKAYPLIKVFYAIHDVDEANGAFTYYRGSHRLGPWRRRFEQEHSLRQAAYRREHGDNIVFDLDEELQEAGFTPTVLEGAANTLVIANTMGFHKRGRFKDARPRFYGHLDFHYLEFWAYRPYSRLAALLGRDLAGAK